MVSILFTFGDGDKKIFVQCQSVRRCLAQAAQHMIDGSMGDLANILGVDRTVMSNWLADKRVLPPKAQIQLATLLDVPVGLINQKVTDDELVEQPITVVEVPDGQA